MTTEDKLTRAAQWLANARKWKLVEHRQMAGSDGVTLLHIKLDDLQPDRSMLMAAVIKACFPVPEPEDETLAIEGGEYPGPWKLRRAWWEREETRNATDNAFRLHKLYAQAGEGDDDGFISENNCAYRVTLTFRWGVPEVEEAPQGTSGITYAIRNPNRDDETGLWDYILEKRERKTITTGVIEQECDAFREIHQQGWHGIREGMLNHNGGAVPLWPVHNQPQGTLVEDIFIQKNDDCTVDIIQRRTVAKAATGDVARERSAFSETETVTLRNQPQRVDAFAEVSGGRVTQRRSSQNPDGTFDNTQTVATAIPAASARVERHETAFVKGYTVTHRNQPQPVSASVSVRNGIITRRSAEMNADGTFDNTETTAAAIEVAGAAVEAYATMFTEGYTVTHRNQAQAVSTSVSASAGIITRRSARMNDDGTWDNTETVTAAKSGLNASIETWYTAFEHGVSVTDRHAAVAAPEAHTAHNGVTTRVGFRQNDDGTFDNTESFTQELGVKAARREVAVTPWSRRVTVTDRNQPSAAADPDKPGVTVASEVTPGNLYNVTRTEEAAGDAAEESHTLQAGATSTLVDVRTRNEESAPDGHDHDPGAQTPGELVTRRAALRENGLYDVETSTERAVKRCHATAFSDAEGVIIIVRYFNFTEAEEYTLLSTGSVQLPQDALVTVNGAPAEGGVMISGDIRLRRNQLSPGQVNRLGLFDGVLVSRPDVTAGNAGKHYNSFHKQGLKKKEASFIHKDGALYKREIEYTYDMRQDWGLDSGASGYNNALTGSEFMFLGREWYRYQKVTSISNPSDTKIGS